MKKPLVVGVDTKTRAFHYAMDDGRTWSYAGRTTTQEDQDVARAELFVAATGFFRELGNGVHVFCEAPLALQNGATTRLLCMAAGAVFCGFVNSGTDGMWYWVDPSTWKKEALGGAPPRGMKHKPWIRQRCLELWPTVMADITLDSFDHEPDLFDAWCLMKYGRQVVDSD